MKGPSRGGERGLKSWSCRTSASWELPQEAEAYMLWGCLYRAHSDTGYMLYVYCWSYTPNSKLSEQGSFPFTHAHQKKRHWWACVKSLYMYTYMYPSNIPLWTIAPFVSEVERHASSVDSCKHVRWRFFFTSDHEMVPKTPVTLHRQPYVLTCIHSNVNATCLKPDLPREATSVTHGKAPPPPTPTPRHGHFHVRSHQGVAQSIR